MQTLKDWWWLLGVIAGILIAIFKIGWKAKAQAHRIETLEELVQQQREDMSRVFMAQVATLDGLQQLKCNGNVTVAHRNLQNYLAQRK
jgi:hypothetical protein